jgi:hypothetical protein
MEVERKKNELRRKEIGKHRVKWCVFLHRQTLRPVLINLFSLAYRMMEKLAELGRPPAIDQ